VSIIPPYRQRFLTLTKKTNQKKGQPHHIGPKNWDSPLFSKIDGRCETRFAQTVGVYAIIWLRLPLALFPSIFSKLGKVMMGF
jgi:hypothetical protein